MPGHRVSRSPLTRPALSAAQRLRLRLLAGRLVRLSSGPVARCFPRMARTPICEHPQAPRLRGHPWYAGLGFCPRGPRPPQPQKKGPARQSTCPQGRVKAPFSSASMWVSQADVVAVTPSCRINVEASRPSAFLRGCSGLLPPSTSFVPEAPDRSREPKRPLLCPQRRTWEAPPRDVLMACPSGPGIKDLCSGGVSGPGCGGVTGPAGSEGGAH